MVLSAAPPDAGTSANGSGSGGLGGLLSGRDASGGAGGSGLRLMGTGRMDSLDMLLNVSGSVG